MDGERGEVPGPLAQMPWLALTSVQSRRRRRCGTGRPSRLRSWRRRACRRTERRRGRPCPRCPRAGPSAYFLPLRRRPCRRRAMSARGGATSCVQVSPPSRETYRPLPGPPLVRSHGRRRVCHRPANRMRGLFGSKQTSEAPVSSSLRQHALPGLAAVGGAIDAALLVRAERMAEHRGVGDVGIRRMDDHRADLARLLPDVLPGLAGVGRFVDAVARLRRCRECSPRRSRRRSTLGSDGATAREPMDGDGLIVEDRLPGDAAVGRFPDAAGRGGRVVGAADRRGHRRRAPTRPPAAGPTRRNLRRLNSGGPPLGASSSSARTAGGKSVATERSRRKR